MPCIILGFIKFWIFSFVIVYSAHSPLITSEVFFSNRFNLLCFIDRGKKTSLPKNKLHSSYQSSVCMGIKRKQFVKIHQRFVFLLKMFFSYTFGMESDGSICVEKNKCQEERSKFFYNYSITTSSSTFFNISSSFSYSKFVLFRPFFNGKIFFFSIFGSGNPNYILNT